MAPFAFFRSWSRKSAAMRRPAMHRDDHCGNEPTRWQNPSPSTLPVSSMAVTLMAGPVKRNATAGPMPAPRSVDAGEERKDRAGADGEDSAGNTGDRIGNVLLGRRAQKPHHGVLLHVHRDGAGDEKGRDETGEDVKPCVFMEEGKPRAEIDRSTIGASIGAK